MLAAESSNSVSELASCPRQSKVDSIRLSKSPPSLWVGSAVPADTLQNDLVLAAEKGSVGNTSICIAHAW